MLQVRLFEDFKGASTLLIWGDSTGMLTLLERVSGPGVVSEIAVGEGQNKLTISVVAQLDRSRVSTSPCLRWECSGQTLQQAAALVVPLLQGSGHQYLDADGEAGQVIISANEYPADLRW